MNARKTRIALGLTLAVILTVNCDKDPASPPQPEEWSLQKSVETAIAANKTPALAVAVIHTGSIETAVAGIRKIGQTDKVTVNDLFHLGSNGKAMTAILMGRLVEEGLIGWDTRVVDVLPELKEIVDPGYAQITLADLLWHRAGLPAFELYADMLTIPSFSGTASEQRLALTRWLLSSPPTNQVGQYVYSNVGYPVAAALAERLENKAWEDLMQTMVFSPLQEDAFIGWPLLHDQAEPWGHILDGNLFTPHNAYATEKLAAYLAPTGDISMSIGDYAKFVQMNLKGLLGQNTLVRPETMQKIHTPNGSYAFGWEVISQDGAVFSHHVGSADTFYCYGIIPHGLDWAVAMCANAAGTVTETAMQQVLSEIILHN